METYFPIEGESGYVSSLFSPPTVIPVLSKTALAISTLQIKSVFCENNEKITSIDYFKNGKYLATSSDEKSIVVYNCHEKTKHQTLCCEKYGVNLIKYTSEFDKVIHSTSTADDALGYLSLQNNNYMHYFKGHTKKVTSLCVSPTNNLFLTGSLDKTVRVWDLRTFGFKKTMRFAGRPVVNIDPEGIVFAVGSNSNSIGLYDLRKHNKAFLTSFRENKWFSNYENDWIGLKFSPNGKLILVYTNGNSIYTFDSLTLKPLYILQGHNKNGFTPEASFSPNSQFVFSGSYNGKIFGWNTFNGVLETILHLKAPEPVYCTQFNPDFKNLMLASAGKKMLFWQSEIND